jgi:hypothetical protein
MSRTETLLQWTACVSSNLPQLPVSQARVLAWWSFGIAMTGSCGRLTVATFLGLTVRAEGEHSGATPVRMVPGCQG